MKKENLNAWNNFMHKNTHCYICNVLGAYKKVARATFLLYKY